MPTTITMDAPPTLHYASQTGPDEAGAQALGLRVMDIAGSTSNPAGVRTRVDALPAGVQALIWLGNLDNVNPVPGFTTEQFQANVDALATSAKVFGYYLSDEPHPANFPNAAADIAARADYVHAGAPNHKTFIIVVDGDANCPGGLGCEFRALKPALSHVDLIGLDPYPLHWNPDGTPAPIELDKLDERLDAATNAGVPPSAVVPVYQSFGQAVPAQGGYYRIPSASELQQLYDRWASLLPNPVLDYHYTYGTQPSVAPEAIINHSELHATISAHNA